MTRLAIVGAGVAGLAAAYALRSQQIEVTIFEKSRGVSGRATTRGKYGVRYDHGANYFSTADAEVRRIVHEELDTTDLVNIDRDVWSFDADGTITPGDIDAPEDPKWTYTNGISTLGKLLARRAPAMLHTETRVDYLEQHDGKWGLIDTEGSLLGHYESVLLTPPSPQTLDIIQESNMDDVLRSRLADGLRATSYTSQFAFIIAYERRLGRPGCYGLVNSDGEHEIAWVSFEHDKPGHVPDGQSVVIIQTSPVWSAERLEMIPDDLIPEVKTMAEDLLDINLKHPSWFDTQRWRYAMPRQPANGNALSQGEEYGLYFAGDYVAGTGRVEAALRTGLAVAETIVADKPLV